MSDFLWQAHGPDWLLKPQTPEAWTWLDDHFEIYDEPVEEDENGNPLPTPVQLGGITCKASARRKLQAMVLNAGFTIVADS